MSDGLFPSWVYIYYTTEFAQHRMTVPVQTDGIAGEFSDVVSKDGTVTNWRTAIEAYTVILAQCYPPQTTFTYAELWNIPSQGFPPQYVDTELLAIVGTNTSPSIKAAQVTLSWRTNNGGNGRTVLMDCIYAPNQSVRPPFTALGAPFVNLASFVVGDGSFIIGRDNGQPVANVRATTKTNDALRKKYGMV